MARTQHDRDELITGINVTPLVDVALVLLVILMVTATYIVARTIPLDLPKAATGEPTRAELAISLDAAGAIWLDGQPVDRATLRERIRAARKQSSEARAVIAADGGVHHRAGVSVIDLLRREGIHRFAINVQPGDLATDG
jgi:biopolymer transport protein ExbD